MQKTYFRPKLTWQKLSFTDFFSQKQTISLNSLTNLHFKSKIRIRLSSISWKIGHSFVITILLMNVTLMIWCFCAWVYQLKSSSFKFTTESYSLLKVLKILILCQINFHFRRTLKHDKKLVNNKLGSLCF